MTLWRQARSSQVCAYACQSRALRVRQGLTELASGSWSHLLNQFAQVVIECVVCHLHMHHNVQRLHTIDAVRLLARQAACQVDNVSASYINASTRWLATTAQSAVDPFGASQSNTFSRCCRPIHAAGVSHHLSPSPSPGPFTGPLLCESTSPVPLRDLSRCTAGPPPAQQPRRVVVTGLGIVSPLGVGVTNVWPTLLRGATGTRALTPSDLPSVRVRMRALPAAARLGKLCLCRLSNISRCRIRLGSDTAVKRVAKTDAAVSAAQAHRGCFDLLPSRVVARVPDGAMEACPWAEQPNGTVQEALFIRYALIAAAEVRIIAVPRTMRSKSVAAHSCALPWIGRSLQSLHLVLRG